MRRTPNPNAIMFILKLIAAIIFIIVVASVVFGCNTPKKIEREDQKAVDRVTAKRPLLDKVAAAIFALYGNGKDTVLTFLPGGIDTVSVAVPVMDEQAKKRIIDSLNELHGEQCTEMAKNAYELGFDQATEAIRNMKIPVKRPDTSIYNIKDLKLHGLYEQHIKELNAKKFGLEGQVLQLDKMLKEEQQESKKQFWWNIGLIVALVVVILLWIYTTFKKPIKL